MPRWWPTWRSNGGGTRQRRVWRPPPRPRCPTCRSPRREHRTACFVWLPSLLNLGMFCCEGWIGAFTGRVVHVCGVSVLHCKSAQVACCLLFSGLCTWEGLWQAKGTLIPDPVVLCRDGLATAHGAAFPPSQPNPHRAFLHTLCHWWLPLPQADPRPGGA